MNILYGFYQPDEGEICIQDQPVKITSRHDAIKKGVGMVHQHFIPKARLWRLPEGEGKTLSFTEPQSLTPHH